jgi:peptidoglycan/xylan/chitin deacetylase (PgdA/CDA1 family)
MLQILEEIPILSYHKITSQPEFGLNTLPPRRFQQQMNYLKDQNFHPITFQDLSIPEVPDNPVIITFDDGYSSVYHEALPILKELGFRAVIFIISDYIGKINSWDANLLAVKFSHLDKSQIKAMTAAGMEIGSHGVSHRALTFLTAKQLEHELCHSREILTSLSGRAIETFAYPFGIQNITIQQAVQRAGYKFACINVWGPRNSSNQYCLPRLPVYRTDSLTSFKQKLSPGWRMQLEILKLRLFSWPAFLTPLYQKFFKKLY